MKEGGTGTVSEQLLQPTSMPDKYEIGSHNAIGIAGLSEGVAWVLGRGVDRLAEHDRRLCATFMDALDGLEGVKVYGPGQVEWRRGVFSVNVAGLAPGRLAQRLEEEHGILTRSGLHCAPLAHRCIGTLPEGACRLSFGAFTTAQEVQAAAGALEIIAKSVKCLA